MVCGRLEWNEVTPAGYEVFPENNNAHINAYKGGVFQQCVSGLPETDQSSYELQNPNQYQLYGFEYQPSVSGPLLASNWEFDLDANQVALSHS